AGEAARGAHPAWAHLMAVRVAVAGASGRMGRAIVRLVAETSGLKLAAAIERHGHTDLGRDAGELAGMGALGVPITHDAAAALAGADVWIDFTAPEAAAHAAELAAGREVALVIGTTGLSDAHRIVLERACKRVAVVDSAN